MRKSFLVCCGAAALCAAHAAAAAALAIRGGAVVHFLPDAKPFTIRVEKRDLNIYEGGDELQLLLLAPDRRVLANAVLPDDGDTGRTGRRTIRPQVKEFRVAPARPGAYLLHLIPRNGDQIFNVTTTCPRHVFEGDIFLNDGRLRGELYFMPPARAFKVAARAAHKPGCRPLRLYDARGKLARVFQLKRPMQPDEFIFPAGERRGLWRFEIAAQDVQLEIPRVRFWTPERDAYFDAASRRWMLTPYSIRVYLRPGESRRVRFELRNRRSAPRRMVVRAEASKSFACRVLEPAFPTTVSPKKPVDVVVEMRALANSKTGEEADIPLTAGYLDGADAAASATIRACVGAAPAARPLAMPIVLRPYEHENAQFGYLPRYPCNPPYFDLANRPYIRQRGADRDYTAGVYTLERGRWVLRPFAPALKERYKKFSGYYRGAGWVGTKTVFDRDGDLYTLVRVRLHPRLVRQTLLYSRDGGRTFQVYELPKGSADIEQWTGHNTLPHPPPILVYAFVKPHPARFCSYHKLMLFLPRKTKRGLDLGEPALISDKCVGACMHSGNPAATATRDGRTHVVWIEVTDPKAPGAATYIRTYYHREHRLGPKVLLGYAPPVNDVHNVPGICLDSEGYLHVIAGAHGRPFQYFRSLQPNDAYSGWTPAEPVCRTGYRNPKTGKEEGRQTYLAFVCDGRDTLHIAFRQWRCGVDPYHAGRNYAALSYQRKPKGKPWEKARPLVVAPLPGYSIYYHKLTLDRRGRLYLSYSYLSKAKTYQDDLPGLYHYRAVLTSQDGGDTWKLAATADFAAGMKR